jgi:hypothetical protein
MHTAIIFPIYRKLQKREVYYCITSALQFVELSRLGQSYSEVEINAVQYPEKVRIHEMIEGQPPFETITETEFEQVKSYWSKTLKKFDL